ncbi:hypothetical protein PGTUg99_005055 [Puccinia graminis f. sp. tritici]|uniref:DyP dimeric alpha+beta barrel domain-containing protein n=1 Tax=Puccinia graminis f. sp. tritici TaxID=56615 RepID=A0A5B0RVE0_PUCGR|nr:hypothetical protein PGTUg99_005055 [Puccinia graminis f. sp. tritici]
MSSNRVNLSNVQGDIIIALQKRYEAFWFCTLKSDPGSIKGLRKKLKSDLLPLITTTQGVIDTQKVIADYQQNLKEGEDKKWLPITHVNLGFTFDGLEKLGLKAEEIPNGKNGVFSKGQPVDAVDNLGDPIKNSTRFGRCWMGTCRNLFFAEAMSGLVISMDSISMAKIKGVNARPEDEKAGIVEPNVILLGYTAATGNSTDLDPYQAWLKDGSFMAFRELRQLVPEFQSFCAETAKKFEHLNISGEFIAARIIGRWKSGAPISLAPNEDNPELSGSQDFDYSDELKQERCPYAAHIRYFLIAIQMRLESHKLRVGFLQCVFSKLSGKQTHASVVDPTRITALPYVASW